MKNLLRILRPARFLRQRAIYSGLFGGNRTWLMLGGAAWGMRWLRGLFGAGEPSTVFLEEIKPGQRLVITHPEATKKKSRRKRG